MITDHAPTKVSGGSSLGQKIKSYCALGMISLGTGSEVTKAQTPLTAWVKSIEVSLILHFISCPYRKNLGKYFGSRTFVGNFLGHELG